MRNVPGEEIASPVYHPVTGPDLGRSLPQYYSKQLSGAFAPKLGERNRR